MLSQKWLDNNLGIKVYAQKRIYTYDTVGDTVSDTVGDTVNDTLGDTHSDTSKKEILKIIYISKDIYVSTDVDLVIEK